MPELRCVVAVAQQKKVGEKAEAALTGKLCAFDDAVLGR